MLVLSRRIGETIVIGANPEIVVTVVAVESGPGDRCRLGIDAPRDVLIDRAEVRRRREADQRRATT